RSRAIQRRRGVALLDRDLRRSRRQLLPANEPDVTDFLFVARRISRECGRFAAEDQVFRLHIPLSLTSRPSLPPATGRAGRLLDGLPTSLLQWCSSPCSSWTAYVSKAMSSSV